jgi:hypothetical protein
MNHRFVIRSFFLLVVLRQVGRGKREGEASIACSLR